MLQNHPTIREEWLSGAFTQEERPKVPIGELAEEEIARRRYHQTVVYTECGTESNPDRTNVE